MTVNIRKFKRKMIIFFLFLFLFFLPWGIKVENKSLASENLDFKEESLGEDLLTEDSLGLKVASEEKKEKDIFFKARVLEVLEEVEKETADGQKIIQQNIKLLGLEKEFKNKEVFYYGIGDIELIDAKIYFPGDSVLLLKSGDQDNPTYYITDYLRTNNILLILFFFVIFLFLVGRWKGFRALLSLFLTFFIIIFFIIPKIISGFNPILITLIGSLFILFIIVYLTEGFNLRAHISFVATTISLILVIAISYFFIFLTKLTGVFNEDVFILLNIGDHLINFKGILLAGIIIGALGVLDDVIISQTASVEELIRANPQQSWQEVFKKAYRIGVSHISSMTNTLFLAYAGASLPLLILFASPDNPFNSLEQIINNESVATEIVRALSGSLGIVLSLPLTTLLASWFLVYQEKKKKNKI